MSKSQDSPAPTAVAWAVRGVSLVLVLSLLGYFVYLALQPETRPRFTFEIQEEKCAERNGRWALPVKVTNEGSMSVHGIHCSAGFKDAADQREKVVLPALGPGESVTTEFWFDEDPQGRNVTCKVDTYVLP